jgi:hypothetical protein
VGFAVDSRQAIAGWLVETPRGTEELGDHVRPKWQKEKVVKNLVSELVR